jgi:hypothetical protein
MLNVYHKNLVTVLCVSALLGACASTPTTPKTLQYFAPEVQGQLQKSSLLPSLETYWQAHTERNWKLRYQMEDIAGKVEEGFYVAYYGNAWIIKSAVVKNVEITDSTATVDIEMVYQENGGIKTQTSYTMDKWMYVNGKWVHVVVDPMLTGKFPLQ